MFLEVFLPFAREQNLFVWFDGFHFVSGRSSSPRDSWLAPLVNNRQACEVISMVMLAFGVLNGLGLWVMKKLHLGSISRTAKIAVTCYATTGIISFVLGRL